MVRAKFPAKDVLKTVIFAVKDNPGQGLPNDAGDQVWKIEKPHPVMAAENRFSSISSHRKSTFENRRF